MTKSVRGWTVTMAGSGINLALGVLYTWSVFAAALIEDLALSKMAASLPFALACAIIALMVVPGALLQERLGPRWVATFGGLFAGGGLIISSYTSSLALLAISFGIMVGMGIGLGYSAATLAPIKWFPEPQKRMCTGIVIGAFALASLYLAPLTNTLIQKFGIPVALRLEGLTFLIVIVLLAQVLAVPYIIKKDSTPKDFVNYTCLEMLKDGRFYLLWLMLAAGATAGLMIISQLSIITKVQTGTSWGFVMVALLAIFNAGGRILAQYISNHISFNWTMCLFFTLQGINLLTFILNKSPLLIALGAILTGLCYGSVFSLFPRITYDFFGKKNGRANYGLLFTAWGVGGVSGPLIAGAIINLTSSYFYAYLMAAFLSLLSCLLGYIFEK